MFCSKCHNPVPECECDDITERIARLAASGAVLTDRCKGCLQNRPDCDCEEYVPFDPLPGVADP